MIWEDGWNRLCYSVSKVNLRAEGPTGCCAYKLIVGHQLGKAVIHGSAIRIKQVNLFEFVFHKLLLAKEKHYDTGYNYNRLVWQWLGVKNRVLF